MEQFICAGDNQFVAERVCTSQVLAVVESFIRGNKQIAVEDRGYRLFVWLWVRLFPVRRPILTLRRKLGKLRKKRKK